VRRQGPATKWAIRVGAEGLVPAVVRRRTDKAPFISVFGDELEAVGGARMFEDLRLEELGWVDGPEARALWAEHDAARRAGAGHPWAQVLWNIAWTDAWLCGMVRNANP
jgi:hypothetical protein